MTNQNKRDFISRANQQADKRGDWTGDLLSLPNPVPTNHALVTCREYSTDAITKATARYFNHSSLENLAEVSIGIGNSILALCNLARVLGIPLERVLDRLLVAQDVGESGTVMNTQRQLSSQAIWYILDQAKAEQQFERHKDGGSHWTGDQVYESFNRQGNE